VQHIEIQAGDVADDAAGGGRAQGPAVAQARPNTLGTEMPMDMEANWSSDTARMEMPMVDFLKNQENPPIRKRDDHAHQLGPGDGHPPKEEWGWWAEIRERKVFRAEGRQVDEPVDDGHQADGHHDHRDDGLADQAAQNTRSTLMARKKVITMLRKKEERWDPP
jgi:hypothetical protein